MKLTKLSTLRADASGVSLVEVLVAMVIFSMAILGLTSAGMVAGKQLQMSRTDMRVWTAVHSQMDKVTAMGYDSVSAGSGTVQGFAISWDVQAGGDVSAAFTAFCSGLSGAQQTACLAAPDFPTYCAGLAGAEKAACDAALAAGNLKEVSLVVQAPNSQGVLVPDTFVTYLADWTP